MPGREKEKGLSLRGVWEGLKVFKRKEVDEKWWKDENLIGKVRKFISYGSLEGISIGDECLGIEKGRAIFEEVYIKEAEERFGKLIDGIRKESEKREVVLLDYKEGDERKFINHAEILKELIEKE